jgi:hypothetical protein
VKGGAISLDYETKDVIKYARIERIEEKKMA